MKVRINLLLLLLVMLILVACQNEAISEPITLESAIRVEVQTVAQDNIEIDDNLFLINVEPDLVASRIMDDNGNLISPLDYQDIPSGGAGIIIENEGHGYVGAIEFKEVGIFVFRIWQGNTPLPRAIENDLDNFRFWFYDNRPALAVVEVVDIDGALVANVLSDDIISTNVYGLIPAVEIKR